MLKKRPHHPLLGLALVLVLASACGDKENAVGGNVTSPIGINPPITGGNIPNLPSDQYNIFQQMKQSLNCRQGPRLQQDVTFSTQSFTPQNSLTTIRGPFQLGAAAGSGSVNKIYVGVSVFNDIMMVTKVTNGTQVLGYNVTLSMCSERGQDGTPYIDDSRQITQLGLHNQAAGIVITEQTRCGVGTVDSAQMVVVSAQAQINSQYGPVTLPPYNAVTTFYRPACNGQY